MSDENLKRKNGIYVYKRLLSYAKPYWRIFLIGVLATLVGSSVDAGFAWMIKPVIDKGFIDHSLRFVQWLPIGLVLAFMIRGAAGFCSNYFISRVGRSVVMDFRQVIFSHLLRCPASYFDSKSSGQLLATLLYNVEQIASAATTSMLTMFREGCLTIGLLVVMFTISWELTSLFLVSAPVIFLVVNYSGQRMRKLSKNVQTSMGEVTQVAEETIEGYRVIRLFGGEAYETNKFNAVTKLNRARELKVVVTNSLGSTGVQLIASIPIALTLYLATSSRLAITAGSFAAMVAAMLALLRPVRRLTRINSNIQKGLAGAESIFELLNEPLEVDEGAVTLGRAKGDIVFENVSFHYPNYKGAVLHEIDLNIKAGQSVALVGRSGSGKSTMVSLFARFYDLTKGRLTLDGKDLSDYPLVTLRRQFAYVSQSVTLFNDTVLHNIAYGSLEEVDEDRIIEAAIAAHAHEFITELPNGYNTIVGENGVLLSGGQRQRIAIARALLKDAPILVLDEATSALDSESERLIQEALEKLMQNRTTIVIAHRLSTIEHADMIVVMEGGRIAERGRHQELITNNEHYANLYRLQYEYAGTKLAVQRNIPIAMADSQDVALEGSDA